MTENVSIIPDLSSELIFQASRSTGPGGQNVNKVNSKIELRFSIEQSSLLSDLQKDILRVKLSSKISTEGFLIVVSQRNRSQLTNKEDCVQKFYAMLEKALKPVRPRKKTKPTHTSIEKRLADKKVKAMIKENRKQVDE